MVREALQSLFEHDGSVTNLIAAETHWQLGRTENHGGWFARVLEKVIKKNMSLLISRHGRYVFIKPM